MFTVKNLWLPPLKKEKNSLLWHRKGLLLGGAPDTFLGAAVQTCRKMIDDGFIGRPIGATAPDDLHGHELASLSWVLLSVWRRPMMDMGSYMTALVNLLGSAKGVDRSGHKKL